MAYTGIISEMDCYLFGQGTHYEIYEKLGAHKTKVNGKEGIYFAVWAPSAIEVSVVGEFNDWNVLDCPMTMLYSSGIFEAFVPGAKVSQLYKFAIKAKSGTLLYKADPYALSSELRPGTASRIADISDFTWTDEKWRKKQSTCALHQSPLSIYEVHIGSWRLQEDGSFYNYRQYAELLADYLSDMGYTHVELIGISEYPYDASWGYQVTGYYAPTSRYGTPADFMYFVNYLHNKGFGVLLDWVPSHFPRDAHGLSCFDGTPTYEYADSRKGEHPEWGTKIFDYSKTEVKNFLIANALYWLEVFHIDGLRVDAVASMLYLDYGKQDGQWIANQYGGNENLEAVEFLRHLNSIIKSRNPHAMVIAEESTAWPGVTHDPKYGGLGFSFKWNMGWMHDFLEYMSQDPYFRKGSHHKMTFGMTYAYSENYILVLSHDEVVHLKCSMLNKMPGIYEDKFHNLKAGYTFMIAHPGKKLLFMGQDFAQKREWSEERSLDWELLEEPLHKEVSDFYRDLLFLYKKYPALYAMDNDPSGFEWVNADDAYRSIYSFIRRSPSGRNNLLFVINFTPMERPDYQVGVPKKAKYKLVLDEKTGLTNKEKDMDTYLPVKADCDGRPYSLAYPLAPYGIAVFKFH